MEFAAARVGRYWLQEARRREAEACSSAFYCDYRKTTLGEAGKGGGKRGGAGPSGVEPYYANSSITLEHLGTVEREDVLKELFASCTIDSLE